MMGGQRRPNHATRGVVGVGIELDLELEVHRNLMVG